jgi:hypothetical protein
MDKICQEAQFTIIAAVGQNPHHGLPGVRGTLRKPQIRLQVGANTFVYPAGVSEEVEKSTWYSRAWTYQEMFLSRRKLFFTGSQV